MYNLILNQINRFFNFSSVQNLNVAILNENEKKQKKDLIIDYLIASRGHHTWYCYR